MDNIPPKIPRKTLFFCAISLLILIPLTKGAAPTLPFIKCPNTTLSTTSTYAPNSAYHTNLNALFSVLSANSNNASDGFYNFTAGTSPPDVAYGLFLCRGDVSASVCRDCVSYAVGDVVKRCPGSKRVTIWYNECLLRYSNVSIFGVDDRSFHLILINGQNVTNVTPLTEVLVKVMEDIVYRASSDDSGKKFATAHANYSPFQTVYGLAQCTPDLSNLDCKTCLADSISLFPSFDGQRGARVLYPNCYVRYETSPFYNDGFGAAPPPPPTPVLSPPTLSTTATASSPGNGGVSSRVIAVIVVSIGVIIMLFIAGFCFLTRRAKKKHYSIDEDDVGDDFLKVQLQYDLATIEAATNNFSDDNEIGKGGFALVYKGLLPDEQEVAVKRLSRTSGQGAQEFKNEVLLVANFHHRNLVRLLGFCLEGEEKILIFEFVPNKSLDYFLFDQQEREKLDWTRRSKIIGGVARGMLYLHEDSRLKIIHRDLKAANILLDADMNAKVSDFGMSRIFGNDESQAMTNQPAGTRGYMSPEYLMHGQFSAKSDVFSFGILVLEIISGKRNNFSHSDDAANLLSYAWKLWREGTPLDLVDPTLEGSYAINEVTRCIHIALLCIQDNPNARPSMATVVMMLNNYSATLALPQQPRFLGGSEIGSNKPIQSTVNEASISDLEPR